MKYIATIQPLNTIFESPDWENDTTKIECAPQPVAVLLNPSPLKTSIDVCEGRISHEVENPEVVVVWRVLEK